MRTKTVGKEETLPANEQRERKVSPVVSETLVWTDCKQTLIDDKPAWHYLSSMTIPDADPAQLPV
jgi:hypothetical protein